MASHYWIKLYHEILEDPKMGQLPDRAWRRAIELFLLAGDANGDGVLPHIAAIAWRLRVDEVILLEDLNELAAVGIVGYDEDADRWRVMNFSKRQAAALPAERMAQYRERQRKAEYYNDYTQTEGNEQSDGESDASVTKGNTDIDTESEQESDIDEEEEKERRTRRSKTPKLTAGQRKFLDKFGAKRFKLVIQRDAVLEMEQKYGTTKLLEAATWAAKRGMGVGEAIGALETALPKWGQSKQPKGKSEPAGYDAIRSYAARHGAGGEGQ